MAGIVHRYHHFGGRGYCQRVYVAELVRPKLQRRTRRSHSLSVEEQVLIGLRFYASGTFYQVVGDIIGADKSNVSDVVKAVHWPAWSISLFHFQRMTRLPRPSTRFFGGGNLPNTIGVIDCTHVHIQAPHERDWEYINQKGRRSINIKRVGEADLIITNCVVKWPGSVHDARILGECFIQRAPIQPTGWHNIRRQCLSTPTMADDSFSCSNHTCAGTLQHCS